MLPRFSTSQRKALYEGVLRLDPDLQAILDEPEKPAEPEPAKAEPPAPTAAKAGTFELAPELQAILDS